MFVYIYILFLSVYLHDTIFDSFTNNVSLPHSVVRSLQVAFPPHDSSDAGSNPAEVVEFLRTEKFREQVLREGL
jgi:hypothetical protein